MFLRLERIMGIAAAIRMPTPQDIYMTGLLQ
jgi:hypothetical protein